MKKLIVGLAKKNRFLRKTLRYFIDLRKKIIYKNACRKWLIQDNIVLFESFMGRCYSCSPRALYEEMLKDKDFKDYELVWFFKDVNKRTNLKDLKRATIIEYDSKEYYQYYAKAKYIITNSRIPDAIKIREDQVYVQCWHGTPLKILGYDIKVEGGNALNSVEEIRQKYKTDAERFSYLLSPSKFTSEKLSSCFNLKENNPNTVVVEEGYPRNVSLFTYNNEDILRIKKEIGIDQVKNKKVILYAPTWRDNQHDSGIGYTYELGIDFDLLRKELADEYIILFTPHYFVANAFDFDKYKGFIYNVTHIEEMNELYIVSDILITDYSSVFFDYANLKRPMLFYMYDLEEYQNKLRGFYFDIKELPGPISRKETELIKDIKNIKKNKSKYQQKYQEFNQKFNYLDDSKASERVIKRIFKEKK